MTIPCGGGRVISGCDGVTMRTALIWLIVTGTGLAADEKALIVELTSGCRVRLAALEEGKTLIAAEDAFSKSLSKFDLQSRLKSGEDVTLEDWKQFVASHVRDWNDMHSKAAAEAIARL